MVILNMLMIKKPKKILFGQQNQRAFGIKFIKNSIISNGAKVYSSLLQESIIGNNAVVRGQYNRLNVGSASEINYK